jgi:NAD(P)-dependent dehydrogenase (short-subunit alcohol dehydrogenase family)
MDVGSLFDVAGKTVVVTGGSRGIGRMIAQGFVEAGATVIISARKAEACEKSAAELSAAGPGTCHAHPADLSTEEGIEGLVARVAEISPRLDVLVNNAGATWGAPIDEFPAAGFDKIFDINVKGVFMLTQALLPSLRAAATDGDPARVINIGSIDGLTVPSLGNYSYSASKAAVHHLTRHLAAELAPSILVNAIAPGPFPSKMMAATLDAVGDQIAAATPVKRIGRTEDVAAAAVYLASRATNFMTGAVIPLDGGLSTTVGVGV